MDIDNKIQPSKKKFKLEKKERLENKMNAHKRRKLLKLEALKKKIESSKALIKIEQEMPALEKEQPVVEEMIAETVAEAMEKESEKIEEPAVVTPTSKKKKAVS